MHLATRTAHSHRNVMVGTAIMPIAFACSRPSGTKAHANALNGGIPYEPDAAHCGLA